MSAHVPIAACLLATLVPVVSGQDWPQFLGPNRNGATTVSNLARNWPKDGPRVLWRREAGEGFSGPVVSGGRLILFHRTGDREVMQALDAASGKPLWNAGYPATYRDDFGMEEGPRATPAVAGGRVFTLGADGTAAAWNLADGRELWRVETRQAHGARKGFFGHAASPLVEGESVILNVGGTGGAGLVALEAATGRLRWKATEDEASYASPIAATVGGRRRLYALTREAFVGLDPAGGEVLFRHPWRPAMHASVSAATPLLVGTQVFLSASYDTGATLLELGPDGTRPREVWAGRDALANHYATSVGHRGFLYGFDGRADPSLQRTASFRCVEWGTGRVRWTEPSLKVGTVTLVNDRLLVITERGEILWVAASPDGFRAEARAQVLPFGVRAHPAVADGRLFARNKDSLVAVELR